MLKKPTIAVLNGIFCFLAMLILLFFFHRVDLSLAYHLHQPFFRVTFNFLQYYLSYPGGISDYTGMFLFQLYGNVAVGIFLVFLQLGLWSWLFYRLVKDSVPVAFSPVFTVLAAIPLIAGHGSYQFTPDISVAVTFGLGLVVLFRAIRMDRSYDFLLYFLAAVVAFYLADSIGLAVFLAGTLPFRINSKKFINALVSLAGIIIIPLAWYAIDPHYASMGEAFRGHFITGGGEAVPFLINSLPLFVFILLLTALLLAPALNRKESTVGMTVVNMIVLLPLLFFVSFRLSYNPVYKKILTIDRLALERKWDELLKAVDLDLVQRKPVLMQVDRALYHKGILLNYLFFYPQNYRQDALIIQGPASSSIAVPLSEIYYDMGFINEARHWTNEALTVLGMQPRILRQLVKTYLITGQYAIAEKYLNILGSSMITRSWASAYSRFLYCDACVEDDPELGRLRKKNPATDFFAAIEDPFNNLHYLISDSIPNPMAFDYFIAWQLLSHKPGEIIRYLPQFRSRGYEKLPWACQEAILMDQANKGNQTFSIPGYAIDEAIQGNFQDFSAILFGKYNGDLVKAKSALAKFSQTYWYYYLYSRPLKSSVQNQGSFSDKY